MIHTQQLTRRFNDTTAVESLTLDIEAGEVFGFLGPNGAGKTTTVRMLCGLICATSGQGQVAGLEVGRDSHQIRRRVGVLTESPGLYERLSAYDNLKFYAKLHGMREVSLQIEKYLSLLGLWARRNEPVGRFSKGMRQKVAIARALLHEPQVVFLDEPTSGLDPESARTVREFVGQLSGAEGRTVFLCTHNLHEAETLCHRIGLIKQRLIKVGTPQSLKRELFESKTVIELSAPLADAHAALDLPFVKCVEVQDGKIVVTLDDPLTQNAHVIERLVDCKAQIRYVHPQERTLEEVYLALVQEAQ